MAMRGQGWLYEKEVKKRIYQERANQYNKEFDELEDQGMDQDKVTETLAKKQYDKRHQNDVKTIPPYEKNDKVLPLGGTIHLGFDKAHMTISSTKTMMQPMEKRVQQTKLIKSQGGTIPELEHAEIQKQNEQRMKERIQYDHIKDLHQMKNQDPNVKKSSYQQNYVFTNYMQDECEHQNFDHHQKKNDLKQYQEAYIVCKKTLRK